MKRKAIQRPGGGEWRRKRIRRARVQRDGLYPGMPGTITHYGRTFKLPTAKEVSQSYKDIGIAMFATFGRTNFKLTEEDWKEARRQRRKYLRRDGRKINLRRQTLSDSDRYILYDELGLTKGNER